MGLKARANVALRGNSYIGPHGHKLAAKTQARGVHNKAKLARLNDQFRTAEMSICSTLTQAEKVRNQLPKNKSEK